jgi:hypothetical protein
VRHAHNPFLITTCLLLTCVAPPLLPVAHAQIPTFDNGPPLLAPGTDRALVNLIKDLQAALKDAPKPSDSTWSTLGKDPRAALVFRRAALALAIRADALGQQGHLHALAARQLADAATIPQYFAAAVDESLIDHAGTEIESPWPDDAAALASELRRRLGVFIAGQESKLTWSVTELDFEMELSHMRRTGVDAIDAAVKAVQDGLTPTLTIAALAPLRNHTRELVWRASIQAGDTSGLSPSALSIYHLRFTDILNQLKQSPFETRELEALVNSADLFLTLFPPPSSKPQVNVLATLSTAERDVITRFVLSSDSKVMTADRIDTIQRWHTAMTRLATAAAKPRSMPPPLKQLDKVITARALAASKDALRGFIDLFRTQTSPRDPAVLAGLAALRSAQIDLDALDHLRDLLSTNDAWDPSLPLAATRLTKLGVDIQNPSKRDAALTTLRSWSTGTDLSSVTDDPAFTNLIDPSCLATAKRIQNVAASLLDQKKSLLNQKSDPTPATLDSLHRQISDLRMLAITIHHAAAFLQLPTDGPARRSRLALTPGLYLTDPTWQELTLRARATLNTVDATLDQWGKGSGPSTTTIRQLRDDLSITAALGIAINASPFPSKWTIPPLFYLLCGTPPDQTRQADALAALCRTIEAQVAAHQARDATATPLLTLARAVASRVSDAPNSQLHTPDPR